MAMNSNKLAYLIIGVDENGDLHDTSETLLDDATYQEIINSHVEPTIKFLLRKREINGKTVGVFVIKGLGSLHFTKKRIYGDNRKLFLDKDKTWKRIGSKKVEMAGKDLQEFIIESKLSKLTKMINENGVFPGAQQVLRDSNGSISSIEMDETKDIRISEVPLSLLAPYEPLSSADIEDTSHKYSEGIDEFTGHYKRELRKKNSLLANYLKEKGLETKNLLDPSSLLGEENKDLRGLCSILPKIVFLTFLSAFKLNGISINQISECIGLSRSQITKRLNSLHSEALGADGLFFKEKPRNRELLFSV